MRLEYQLISALHLSDIREVAHGFWRCRGAAGVLREGLGVIFPYVSENRLHFFDGVASKRLEFGPPERRQGERVPGRVEDRSSKVRRCELQQEINNYVK